MRGVLLTLAGLLAVFVAGSARAGTVAESQIERTQACINDVTKEDFIAGLQAQNGLEAIRTCPDGKSYVAGQMKNAASLMDDQYPWKGGALRLYSLPPGTVGQIAPASNARQPAQFPVAGFGMYCPPQTPGDTCFGGFFLPGQFALESDNYCSSCTLNVAFWTEQTRQWMLKNVDLGSALQNPALDQYTQYGVLFSTFVANLAAYQPPTGNPGGGTNPGPGTGTAGDGATAGACQQTTGNWFTQFWPNLEKSFQCLFVPDKDFLIQRLREDNVLPSIQIPIEVVDTYRIDDLLMGLCGAGGYQQNNGDCIHSELDFILDFRVVTIPESFKLGVRFVMWWAMFFWILRVLGLRIIPESVREVAARSEARAKTRGGPNEYRDVL